MREEKDKRLFMSMLRIRLAQEAIAERYKEQLMRCPTHLCIGQEAVAAGVIEALKNNDIVMSHHRSHAHYLAKGGDLNALIAELYGKKTGCCGGWGGSQHLMDLSVNFYGSASIIGGVLPIASGVAFAEKYKNTDNVVVVFFGDSVIEEGVFHETMNFTSLHNLPILFVCENNFYSVQSHIKQRQPDRPVYKTADSYNMLSYQVDGNDVMAVNRLAEDCITKIRVGKIPIFVEAVTYRIREHVGPDFDYDLGYRDKTEVDEWIKKCPLARMENIIKEKYGDDFIAGVKDKIKVEIENAFEAALADEFPYCEELM